MLSKYFLEITLVIAVSFMSIYPPAIGAVLFGLAMCAIAGVRFVDRLHRQGDDKLKERVDKLAADVERIVLRGSGR